jgi:hypothetical protein
MDFDGETRRKETLEQTKLRFKYFHTPTYALVSYVIKSLKHNNIL